MIITCWYRLTGEEIGFNHISEGFHEERPNPQPRSDVQKAAWRHQRWEPREARLIEGVVHEIDTGERVKWSG